jgi:type I restriction enzyme S subunit
VIALLNEQKQAIIHRTVTRGLDSSVPLKPSGIPWLGDIPQHWEVRRLGRLSKVFNGTTPSRATPEYWSNGTIPWLSSSKVNDGVVTTPSELITSRALASCSLSVVPTGAVLIGLIGQGRTRGMCAMLAIDACISQNLAAAVPGPHISSQYLYYALLASYGDIRELGRGGNQAALNCDIVGRLPIPVPPLEEQRAISRALAEEVHRLQPLESRLKREIELLREYRTRLVADVVTGKIDVREASAGLSDEARLDTVVDVADLTDEMEADEEEAAA